MAVKVNSIIAILLLLSFISTAKAQPNTFNVNQYGGKADQTTDLSPALQAAWKAACASTTPSHILIPAGTYLLNPVTLEGPCKAPIEIQILGTLKAPSSPSAFKEPNWVTFNHVDGLTLSGGGVLDGQGARAWGQNNCAQNKYCDALPINLRFNFVTNSMVREITSLDSKQFHVNVLGCKNLTFLKVNITAPGTSLNTDGIHIGKSSGINITDSNIATGDDCVSIGDGSQQITIYKVTCGPGHGISVGSLGKYDGEEPVVGVTIMNCTLTGTQNGVRIKTWPASKKGAVTGMHFEDIVMNNVGNPVFIDQQYCPWNQCNLKLPSLVKISDVTIKNIRGTSSTQIAVKINCSNGLGCQNVQMSDINLTYSGKEGPAVSQCANVKPILSGKINPTACTSPVSITLTPE